MVEVPDRSPEASPGDTFLFVMKNTAAELGDGMPNGMPPHIAEACPKPRLDLCPEEKRHSKDAANKLVEKTKRKLRRDGYLVNPEDARSLYVIEIDPVEGALPKDTQLYVGETSKTIEERFAQHVAGGELATRHTRGKRLKLLKDLSPKAKYYGIDASVAAETRLGNRLLSKGYKVVGPRNLNE